MNKQLQKIIQQIIKDLMPYNPEKIILFGSAVKGRMDEHSDIDIIVIKKTKERFLQRLKKVALMLPSRERVADVLVYTPEEFKQMNSDEYNPFFRNIRNEGKIIYEKAKT